ncbi:hypothetical protein HYH02_010424 [Chlamydomonas schloesseri]|uniref:Uncharacterized protein n=1 Tax=Chlamydomonas schloesseri TaxID=2026947 RepID=A0A835TGA7_9CHLO|nr:hypothetical protein HYH02_010424 [Chlamydomonas schloesseri]|eukprot:KAG2439789.1 hypothetical protein HYH02_010424 [Chlamydomonas schloesseri]
MPTPGGFRQGRGSKLGHRNTSKLLNSSAARLSGPFPQAPAQVTAAFTACTSLEQLVSQLRALQVAGSDCLPAEPRLGIVVGEAASGVQGTQDGVAAQPADPGRRTLNAVQLSAVLTTAEWLASRGTEGAGGRGRGNTEEAPISSPRAGGAGHRSPGAGSRAALGALAPPCRPLTAPVAAVLSGVLATHSEVVADADPPEMAAAMWAAARLRLRLPRQALEPVLEAVWLWDPADLAANRQDWEEAEVEAGAGARQQRRRGRRGGASASMGARELCLLLYGVSVLLPDYLRRHAGGFLEALNSYEAAAAAAAAGSGRAGAGGRLSREQVVGVVTALARAGARLDEEGMEFVMQACSSRLASFSIAHLSGLLAATHRWSSGASAPVPAQEVRLLHSQLLQELLLRLDQEQQRNLARRQQEREQERQQAQPGPLAPQETGAHVGQATGGLLARSDSSSDPVVGRALVTALQACVVVQAANPQSRSHPQQRRPGGSGSGSDDGGEDKRGPSGRSGGIHVTVTVPYPALSRLLRQLRRRASCLGAREVCEALRLMAALRRGGHQRGIAAWKEGLRALLQRWAQCLARHQDEGEEAGAAAEYDGGSIATAEDARTLATSLHAAKQLGVRLHSQESSAVAAGLLRLAPAMSQLADCAMCLAAVEGGVLAPAPAGPGVSTAREQLHHSDATEGAAAYADGSPDAGWTLQATGTGRVAGDGAGGSGVAIKLGVTEQRAVHALLRRSGELLEQHLRQLQRKQHQELTGAQPTADRKRWSQPQHRHRVSELVCLVRAAAAAGTYPPAAWWAAWGGCVQVHGRHFTAAEAADVLYSVARLQQSRKRRAAARLRQESPLVATRVLVKHLRGATARNGLPRSAGELPGGVTVAKAAAVAQTDVSPLPVPSQLLVALLAVALGAQAGPGRSPGAADSGRGPSGDTSGMGLGPISAYYLVWAMERLQLSGVAEAALWAQSLSTAAARALPRLTPRKQVLLMRSATRAWRAVDLPLPVPVVQAWWQSFGPAAVARAQAATLAYAAAVTAEAGLIPPPGWAAELCHAAAACAGHLSAREAAALVVGMRLRPRLGMGSRSAAAATQSLTEGTVPNAAPAPVVRAVDAELGLARVLLRAMRRKATQPAGSQGRALARRLAWLLSRFLMAAQAAGSSGNSNSNSSSPAPSKPPANRGSVVPFTPVAATLSLRLAPRPQLSLRHG